MSSSPTPRDNALAPTLFLIGVTVLLVYFAVPRPYRDAALATPQPTATVAVVAAAPVEPTPEDHLTLMMMGLEQVPSSSVKTGSRLFSVTCTACHGSDAKGILGLGKTMIASEFVNSLNDDQLVAFLHVGRASSDPANTTRVTMPAKGGNPSLTDADLNAIVDYLRSMNGAVVVNDIVGEPTAVPTLIPFQPLDLNAIPSSSTIAATPASIPAALPTTAATPVTSYGYDTQKSATEEPAMLPTTAATPATSYGYDTQTAATEEPAAPSDATPTTSYSYNTLGDATSVPPVYGYETQGTQP